MVKLKAATKWLILKRFQHVIECPLHISGLKALDTSLTFPNAVIETTIEISRIQNFVAPSYNNAKLTNK